MKTVKESDNKMKLILLSLAYPIAICGVAAILVWLLSG